MHKSAVGKNPRRGWAYGNSKGFVMPRVSVQGIREGGVEQEYSRDRTLDENKGIVVNREGIGQEGVETMGSKTSPASSDISSRLSIITGFLSCRNASMDKQAQSGFSKDTGKSKTCLAEPGEATSKGPKTPHTSITPKGVGSNQDLYLGKRAETQGSRNSVGRRCINLIPSLLLCPQ